MIKYLIIIIGVFISSLYCNEIKQIEIISSINNAQFSNSNKVATIDNSLDMTFVIKFVEDNIMFYYTEANSLILDGISIENDKIRPINNLNIEKISWFKIEEANGDYYNNCKPQWHWENIRYSERVQAKWYNKTIITPNVSPSVYEPVFCDGKYVGTMRYKVEIKINSKLYSSHGKNKVFKGSISSLVHRISLKGNTDNAVTNNALALCNLPYIWGSSSFSADYKWDNQAERFIGADCADFAVAAHQLAGNEIAYDSIKHLTNTKIITTVYFLKNQAYLAKGKEEILVGDNGVQVGDFIYWKYNQPGSGHVALYFSDKSDPMGEFKGKPDGLFNRWDLVIHTLFHEPEIKKIGDAYSGPIRVFRFKK